MLATDKKHKFGVKRTCTGTQIPKFRSLAYRRPIDNYTCGVTTQALPKMVKESGPSKLHQLHGTRVPDSLTIFGKARVVTTQVYLSIGITYM